MMSQASCIYRLLPTAFFAPRARDYVAIVEEFLEPRLDHERRGESAERAERRLVVYLVAEQRAFGVRLDDVAVAPALEGAFDLHVLEHARRIVPRVARD